MSQEQEKEKIVVEEMPTSSENIIVNICIHEWTIDYIDISLELSQKICYCVKCDVTKE